MKHISFNKATTNEAKSFILNLICSTLTGQALKANFVSLL